MSRMAALGVAAAGAAYLLQRQLVWQRACAAVSGLRVVAEEVPCAACAPLHPPPLLPPAATAAWASAAATAEAAWRDWR